jgi:hypothetical protein
LSEAGTLPRDKRLQRHVCGAIMPCSGRASIRHRLLTVWGSRAGGTARPIRRPQSRKNYSIFEDRNPSFASLRGAFRVLARRVTTAVVLERHSQQPTLTGRTWRQALSPDASGDCLRSYSAQRRGSVYLDHVRRRGRDFFTVICDRGLEGMVGELAASRYVEQPPHWVKVLNPDYSQQQERHELFERRYARNGTRSAISSRSDQV